jgi:hypothetical protein
MDPHISLIKLLRGRCPNVDSCGTPDLVTEEEERETRI